MTGGTLSTVVSPRSDPVRASGRAMVVTGLKINSSAWWPVGPVYLNS